MSEPVAESTTHDAPRNQDELDTETRQAEVDMEKKRYEEVQQEMQRIRLKIQQLDRNTEQINRKTEQLEQQLAAAFVPVRQCIAEAPITTQPLYPRWGPPEPDIIKPSTKSSPATQPSWVDPDHIMEWTDDKFAEFLKRPDQQMVHFNGEDISMIELILCGRCDDSVATMVRGEALGSRAGLHGVNLGETESPLKFRLGLTLWNGLEMVCGGGLSSKLFPIAHFLKTRIMYGSELGWSERCGNIAIGTRPPHLDALFESGTPIQSVLNPPPDPIADALANVSDPQNGFTGQQLNDLHQQLLSLTHHMARMIIEVQPDYDHPIKYDESETEEAKETNAVVRQGLYAYIKSKFYNAKYDPVQQATTYCLATLTRYFMVATGNRCTYGYVDVLPDGTYRTYLTRTFHWPVPNDIPLDGHVYPHFEIIVRFLLAGRNDWWLGPGYPDSLKLPFKKRQQGEETPHSHYLLAQPCWTDLWDEIRFAVPATNPVMEGYMGKLPGDAELLASGRTGPVYRKTLQGRDAVVKVVVKSRDRCSITDRRITKGHVIAEELAYEAAIYKRYHKLQELNVIPQLLWYGEMITDMVDALVTAYAGKSLEDVELTKELVNKARMALTMLHEHGILHGDVAKRNFAVSDDEDGQVRILDFAFSKLRQDMKEKTWTRKVKEEWKEFCYEFGIRQTDDDGGGGDRKRTFEEMGGT